MTHIDYSKTTLLSVLAHPDDETFGSGGTLALYASRGTRVYLVCATRGEVGEVENSLLTGYASVAELREHELRCAAKTLGIQEVYFLDYRDSGMLGSPDNAHPQALAAQPLDQVAARVCTYIRRSKPQVVITFDPAGGYRHPDHIAIHRATLKAFQLAGDASYTDPENLPPYQPDRLFYQTISKKFIKAIIFLIKFTGKDPHKFGRNNDIDLVSIAADEFPIHTVIDFRPVVDIRNAASACHASQGGKEMVSGVQKLLQKLFRSEESYMQAYPDPDPHRKTRDLFSDIGTVSD